MCYNLRKILKDSVIKKISICLFLAFFCLFLSIATFFGPSGAVGNFGKGFSNFNFMVFGFLAPFYLLFLLYPLFLYYKNSVFSSRDVRKISAGVLIFVVLLCLQYLWLGRGELAKSMVEGVRPFIGIFGVYVCLLILWVFAWTLLSLANFLATMSKILIFGMRALEALGARLQEMGAIILDKKTKWQEERRAKKESEAEIRKSMKDFMPNSKKQVDLPNPESQALTQDFMPQNQQETKNREDFDEEEFLASEVKTFYHVDIPKQNNPKGVVLRSAQNLPETDSVDARTLLHQRRIKAESAGLLDFALKQTKNSLSPRDLAQNSQMQTRNLLAKMQKIEQILQEDTPSPQNPSGSNWAGVEFSRASPASNPGKNAHNVATSSLGLDWDGVNSLSQSGLAARLQDLASKNPSQDFSAESDHALEENPNSLQDYNQPHQNEHSLEQNSSAQPFECSEIFGLDGRAVQDKGGLAQELPTQEIAKESEQFHLDKSAQTTQEHAQEQNSLKDSFSREFVYKSKFQILTEVSENAQMLEGLEKGEREKPRDYVLPSLELLSKPPLQEASINEEEIDKKAQNLLEKLNTFKIDGDVVSICSGPLISTFEFKPATHIKVNRICSLSDDLAMALSAQSIRIQAPIPGKNVVGIEIPNSSFQTVYMREILESEIFQTSASPLALALGKDIAGNPFVADLKKLPHLLVAGTTGSGKSVGVNAMILSMLYRNSPDHLRLIMIDPKQVEFSLYEDIPHLLTPIITDPKKAITALNQAIREMESRFGMMRQIKVKNIENYNQKCKSLGLPPLPYLVIIIDELADLMMTGGKEAETPIIRIAQMGRASGMHLIIATQRPSADVVTGLIKTNLPSRIAFKVSNKIDSRVVIDTEGAQSLLGRGDMLFSLGGGMLTRIHAPWSSEEEIEAIVSEIKAQREVEYDQDFDVEGRELLPSIEGNDDLARAKEIILSTGKTSISFLQRQMGVGYNKAANCIEELERQGFLSAEDAKGRRSIIGR
ncbi:cell division protein [Helicobacter mustelae]|nr:cell division protein [Helicobacter mustelae]